MIANQIPCVELIRYSIEKSIFASIGASKNGDTYFHAGVHYHRLGKLNYCVRDGNRWDLSDMVAKGLREGYFAQHAASCLVNWQLSGLSVILKRHMTES